MNLDELQSVRDRERQSDSLQQLRDSFYADAGELIQELREERDRAADRADDPFDDPEVNRITDDINTAEQTVEAIYERRVGKLVKMASFAAADMPTEDEGLTAEERELFESMVASIENNRDRVFAILDGEDPDAVDRPDAASQTDPSPADTTAPTDTASETGDAAGVDAADLMGSGEDAPTPGSPEPGASAESSEDGSGRPVPPQDPAAEGSVSDPDHVESSTSESDAPGEPASETGRSDPVEVGASGDAASPPKSDGDGGGAGQDSTTSLEPTPDPRSDGGTKSASDTGGTDVDRRTVRITEDVGEILGIDERAYDLASEDVVTLPAANADPLVQRDAAEPLDQ